jgi:hypothetical protein
VKKLKATKVTVEHPVHGVVNLSIMSEGIKRTFEMSSAEAATLALDLAPFQVAASGTAPSSNLPSVLPLPLVTGPVRTASMTDYPDGLAVELRMASHEKSGALQSVRIPMFADTARELIGALQERLDKIGQAGPSNASPTIS